MPRYQTMRGKMVERRFGWDCHGLPAELHSEKELKLSGRRDIVEYGVARFNEHCRSSVMQFRSDWEYYVNRAARWVDFENDYRTMDLSYMESTMWAFKQLWDKGLVYEGYRVVPYSWAAQTPLSHFETRLDNSYRSRQDPALTVTFKLHPKHGETIAPKLLAWTTTPWTLPSNLALAVHPEADYALLEKGGEHWILADASRDHYAKELEGWAKVGTLKGAELIGRTYEPLFPFFADAEKAFVVLGGEFIELGEGTGVVHIAPAFGEDDMAVAQAAGLPVVDPVDFEGNFTAEVPPYAGQNVFEANKAIIRDLKAAGVVVRHETYEHNYPHCWRTDQPLIYKAIPSWYVKVTAFKDRMVELNQGIKWVPEHVKDGIFGNWLANARDWNIGRNRFWGSPIPVWKSDNPEYPRIDVYGSIDEIERDFGVRPKDLHRPYVDDLVRPNPDDPTGKSMMRRVEDVLDCWFESGSMPFCQVHYPFENKDWFDEPLPRRLHRRVCRPDPRLVLHADGDVDGAVRSSAPFRSCICHGVVLDENKQKLSKRLKNYPDPVDVFNTYGADALRWYMISSPLLVGGDLAMPKDGRAIGEAVRSVLLPIWNAYSFFTLYANIDGIKGSLVTTAEAELDRYILGKTAELVRARRGGDGPARHRRRLRCAAAVHRGAQQLVHPPLARALLEERAGRRQARRLRHALHRAGHHDAGDGAVPALPDRDHPPRARATARACISRTGRTRSAFAVDAALVERMDLARAACSAAARSAPPRICATACRSARSPSRTRSTRCSSRSATSSPRRRTSRRSCSPTIRPPSAARCCRSIRASSASVSAGP